MSARLHRVYPYMTCMHTAGNKNKNLSNKMRLVNVSSTQCSETNMPFYTKYFFSQCSGGVITVGQVGRIVKINLNQNTVI